MIDAALFGFFTGLHLALLQFGLFFVLLMNVTSTYVTYAVIVVSWMTVPLPSAEGTEFGFLDVGLP